jgi:hypothetical protein
LVDLDGDGHIDVLSGSWPGELFLFRGRADRTFGPPEMIKDKDGEIINIGGEVRKQSGGGLLITGNAKFETTPEGTFVTYKGKRYKSTPEEPIYTTGCASAVFVADWDGDGDLDLLVGDIQGDVQLIPNEGTAKAFAFGKPRALEVVGPPARADGNLFKQLGRLLSGRGGNGNSVHVEGDAGPHAADWDGDGDLDLLVGAGDGSVSLFRNVGSPRSPKLAGAEVLVPPGEAAFGGNVPKQPRRGIRSKVCAADWNGDGRLDLLVGDYATQAPDLPEPTPEQKAKQASLRKELQDVRRLYGEKVQKIFGPNRAKTQEELDRANKELQETSRKMQELSVQLPAESEYHGWIWLFLRKPAEKATTDGLGPHGVATPGDLE